MGAVARAELSILIAAGHKVEPSKGGGDPHTVDGKFLFWSSTKYWKAIDGSVKGYTARKLRERAKMEPAP